MILDSDKFFLLPSPILILSLIHILVHIFWFPASFSFLFLFPFSLVSIPILILVTILASISLSHSHSHSCSHLHSHTPSLTLSLPPVFCTLSFVNVVSGAVLEVEPREVLIQNHEQQEERQEGHNVSLSSSEVVEEALFSCLEVKF